MKSFGEYLDIFVFQFKFYLNYFIEEITTPRWGNNVYMVLFLVMFLFILEGVSPWKKNQKTNRKYLKVDVFYTVFNYILIWGLGGYAICNTTAIIFHDFSSEYLGINEASYNVVNMAQFPHWAQLVLIFLFTDLFSYLGHLLMHKVPFLWKLHKVHHASGELDVFNAGRGHILENFIYPLTSYIPLAIMGFSILDTFTVYLIIYAFSIFTHCNIYIPLGPLKYLFNNPQMHIWHHDKEVRGKNGVNYGDALSIWDFIFRTAYIPKDRDGREIELGFDDYETYPKGFLAQQIQPFKEMFRRSKK